MLWTANTERFTDVVPGLNDTADNLMRSIKMDASEVSPSTLFAVASILEGVSNTSLMVSPNRNSILLPVCRVHLSTDHRKTRSSLAA